MKKLFKYTMLFAVGALMSCTEEYEYDGVGAWDATENYNNVAFAVASEEIELEPTAETKYTFTMTRANTAAEAVVPFEITENTDGVFEVGQVKFAAGDSVATGTVSFNNAEVGKPYTLKLSVTDPNFVSQYSKGTVYSLTVNRVKWNPAGFVELEGQRYDGYAMYTDDIVTGMWGVENLSFPTLLQERDDKPGYFRLINTYGNNWGYVPAGYATFDDSRDWYILIDATDPEKVFIPTACNTGMDFQPQYGYGNIYVHSMAGRRIEQGREAEAAPYYGTYKNGKITFPTEALLVTDASTLSQGFYAANKSGKFELVIDPTLDPYKASIATDFEWEALYTGAFTSEQLNVTGSATLYKGTCVVNTDACDSVFAAEYGTAYCIESPYAEGYNLFFSVLDGKVKTISGYEVQSTGLSAMGADVFAKINQGTSSFSDTEVVLNITFQNADGSIVYGTANETLSNITYTPVGLGTYTYVALASQPTPVPDFVMSKRDDKEDVYCIEQWAGPLGGTANLIFTWNKETNKCTLPTQSTTLMSQSGEVFISDIAYYVGDAKYYEAYPCVYDPATKTFTFTVFYHIASGGVFTENPVAETFTVEFDEAASSAKVVNQINKWDIIMGTPKASNSIDWKNPFVGTKVNIKNVKAVNGPAF